MAKKPPYADPDTSTAAGIRFVAWLHDITDDFGPVEQFVDAICKREGYEPSGVERELRLLGKLMKAGIVSDIQGVAFIHALQAEQLTEDDRRL